MGNAHLGEGDLSYQGFGPWLTAIMAERGYTSDVDLARALGLKYSSSVGKWKKGQAQPDTATLVRMSRVLDVPYKELLIRAGHATPQLLDMDYAPPTLDDPEVADAIRLLRDPRTPREAIEGAKAVLERLARSSRTQSQRRRRGKQDKTG